jgi:hypothetical protein
MGILVRPAYSVPFEDVLMGLALEAWCWASTAPGNAGVGRRNGCSILVAIHGQWRMKMKQILPQIRLIHHPFVGAKHQFHICDATPPGPWLKHEATRSFTGRRRHSTIRYCHGQSICIYRTNDGDGNSQCLQSKPACSAHLQPRACSRAS